ncbi:MAG: pitrilysin family protein [Patescibacteria group bacterium]|nr:pitrilysin family protein [Patescibacteria group bacterium]
MFKKITLPNGLRVILVPAKNTKAVTVLVLVATGSKYEKKQVNGISHFLEHMFFKGTKKRSSTLKIAETLDKVGGAYNAFTSKEFTGYFAKVDSKHFDLALDWVSDIFLNSKIDSKEIKKEKGVIIEEQNMYFDTPTRYISDLWEELLYGDQPAGWKTIGERENILKLQRKYLLNYLKTHYSSLNTIICLAGNLENEKLQSKIQRYFKSIKTFPPPQKIKVIENQKEPQTLLHFKKTDQTHLQLGVRGYDLFHKARYAQEILATILGGNMSSRLFIKVREREGLAYYIQTTSELYTDSGYLVTGAGVPHKEIEKVISLILKEYKKVKTEMVSKKELQKAKDYLKGTLSLNLEPSEAQAFFYSLQELLTEKVLTIEEKFKMIDKVTRVDIQKVAQEIFQPQKLNLALIGPHKDKTKFQQLLKL